MELGGEGLTSSISGPRQGENGGEDMKSRRFESAVRWLAAAMSRRRAGVIVAAGLMGDGLGRTEPAGAKRCKRRLAPCTDKTQCCGKKVLCGTSHGAGNDTCCGGRGASCSSDLTCCQRFLCEEGRCVRNAMP